MYIIIIYAIFILKLTVLINSTIIVKFNLLFSYKVSNELFKLDVTFDTIKDTILNIISEISIPNDKLDVINLQT
jgi:hypothetical protein